VARERRVDTQESQNRVLSGPPLIASELDEQKLSKLRVAGSSPAAPTRTLSDSAQLPAVVKSCIQPGADSGQRLASAPSPRASEVYALVVHACKHLVVLPVAAVHENVAHCSSCGGHLEVRWRAA
jgi:hypothetical protein